LRAAVGGGPQRGQDLLRVLVTDRGRGYGDQVGVLECLQPVRRDHLRVTTGTQRFAGPGRADPEVERGYAFVGPVDPEHLGEHAELEHGDVFHQHDSDRPEHVSQYGRKLWNRVTYANCGGI
jgi:hypothetical protein